MNSLTLYFCPYCTGWTILNHSVCRDCLRHVELSQPDPTPELIHQLVGDNLRDLGVLVYERQDLPRICHVYATSRGLLFSPQIRKMGQKYILADERTLACWLGSLRRSLQSRQGQEVEPVTIDAVALLLETPGALFVAFDSISEVVWSPRDCTIRMERRREILLKPHRRRDGTLVRLKDELNSIVVAGT
jgi:hypothetical protein